MEGGSVSGRCSDLVRWRLNLHILWFSQVLSLMSFGFGLPFLPFYIQEMGVTDPAQLSLYTGFLSAAPAVTMAVSAPFWGIMADKWGRKLMILRAMLAAVFVLGGMGLAREVWQLMLLRGAQGLFTGTITATAAFVASDAPEDRMSSSLGFLSSSNFVGYSVGPVVGGWLAELMGYRFSFLAGALLMLAGFFLVLTLVQENPGSYGHGGTRSKGGKATGILTPMVCSLLLILFVMRLVRSLFPPYLPLYVQDMLGTAAGAPVITGYISGIAGLATALAGISLSRLGDSREKGLLIRDLSLVGLGISCLLVWSNSLWMFGGIYGLLFFFLGGIEPMVMSMTAERTPQENRGVLFGIQGTVGSLGWILAPMAGAFISVHWSNRAILWAMPVILLANLLAVRIVRSQKEAPHAQGLE